MSYIYDYAVAICTYIWTQTSLRFTPCIHIGLHGNISKKISGFASVVFACLSRTGMWPGKGLLLDGETYRSPGLMSSWDHKLSQHRVESGFASVCFKHSFVFLRECPHLTHNVCRVWEDVNYCRRLRTCGSGATFREPWGQYILVGGGGPCCSLAQGYDFASFLLQMSVFHLLSLLY